MSLQEWLTVFPKEHAVGWTVLVLSVVATLGLWLGNIRYRGIGLGIAGVLFAGILLGHHGVKIDPGWLGFIREFGLILFVYTIGIQVGPGFFTSLKKQGLPMNLLAAGIVLSGAVIAVVLGKMAGFDMPLIAGLFSGATTNTPSLGAIQEALRGVPGITHEQSSLPALGYAVAYPFGIFGILLAMLLIRFIFRIDPKAEAVAFLNQQSGPKMQVKRRTVLVGNKQLDGRTIGNIPGMRENEVVVSRLYSVADGFIRNARPEMTIHSGDVLLAVGTPEALDDFVVVVGEKSEMDLLQTNGMLTSQRVLVTSKEVYGRTLRELALSERHEITVTRLTRADTELPASANIRLQFGDLLFIVGEKANIEAAAKVLGNSVKELNHTNFIPVFIGIALGILIGAIPLHIPGVPSAVHLGLAGGPLLVSILLSHIGRVGPVIWYMPPSANLALRELGSVLFLSCVGLNAGGHFVETLMNGSGLQWLMVGAAITFFPLILAGLIARWIMKDNFTNICGLMAGSMTDPPALAFANSITASDAPSVGYATVYPLTMLLRIVVGQLLILYFMR